ncbi:Adenylate cyclase 1 [Durusdinium trenchii]|uniref:Adenylate cyclase 1 n=1 Tax=Durusdinium trenchii TaxID=1381693 RepID=A0ABP0SEH4_9DINO
MASQSFAAVERDSGSEEVVSRRSWPVKKTLCVAGVLLAVVGLGSLRFSNQCLNLDALQGKSEAQMNEVKNRSLAEKTILKAMTKAGHDAQKDWEAFGSAPAHGGPGVDLRELDGEEHHIRKLDALTVLKDRQAIKDFRRGQHNEEPRVHVVVFCFLKDEAGNAECAFNILEAFVSVVGMGDDINGIIRTCPPPRDGESELACQVDASILVAWVGNAAAKISLAASNCALTLNVDSVCAAGVSGLVAAFGEISAGACLGAAVCTPTPPSLTTTKISVLGDQTVRTPETGRRLLIGEGTIGNGVQCGVDVGMVAANIANMGALTARVASVLVAPKDPCLAINKAVNVNRCGKFATEKNPLNVLKGIPDALCTVDIAGAVAYISQVVTFINLIVVHCQDFLDVSALCGGSIAAITTGGAAIAAYGGAVHAACRYNHLLKTPKPTQKVAEWRWV